MEFEYNKHMNQIKRAKNFRSHLNSKDCGEFDKFVIGIFDRALANGFISDEQHESLVKELQNRQ